MAGIFLIVEGETEEQFFKRNFNEVLFGGHYYRISIMLSGRSRDKGRGGRVSYETAVANVKRYLSRSSEPLVVMVYDYYGLHESFKENLLPHTSNYHGKIEAIQRKLENEINNPRLRFRLLVHEFEALLFTSPNIIAGHFNAPGKVAELENILNLAQRNPEKINDHPDTAPNKRLSKLFPGFGKTTDGLTIAAKIGLPAMRDACTYFNGLCRLLEKI